MKRPIQPPGPPPGFEAKQKANEDEYTCAKCGAAQPRKNFCRKCGEPIPKAAPSEPKVAPSEPKVPKAVPPEPKVPKVAPSEPKVSGDAAPQLVVPPAKRVLAQGAPAASIATAGFAVPPIRPAKSAPVQAGPPGAQFGPVRPPKAGGNLQMSSYDKQVNKIDFFVRNWKLNEASQKLLASITPAAQQRVMSEFAPYDLSRDINPVFLRFAASIDMQEKNRSRVASVRPPNVQAVQAKAAAPAAVSGKTLAPPNRVVQVTQNTLLAAGHIVRPPTNSFAQTLHALASGVVTPPSQVQTAPWQTSECAIFIGNITISPSSLAKLPSLLVSSGQVKNCKVAKGLMSFGKELRGGAFCLYKDKAAAEAAMRALAGKELDGQKIVVTSGAIALRMMPYLQASLDDGRSRPVSAPQMQQSAVAPGGIVGKGEKGASHPRTCVAARGFPADWKKEGVQALAERIAHQFEVFGELVETPTVSADCSLAVARFVSAEAASEAVRTLSEEGKFSLKITDEIIGEMSARNRSRSPRGKQEDANDSCIIVHIDELEMPFRLDVDASQDDCEVWSDPLPEEDSEDWVAKFGEVDEVFLIDVKRSGAEGRRGYVKFKEHISARQCVKAGVGTWSESERCLTSYRSQHQDARTYTYTKKLAGLIVFKIRGKLQALQTALHLSSLSLGGVEKIVYTRQPVSSRLHFECKGIQDNFAQVATALAKMLGEVHSEVSETFANDATLSSTSRGLKRKQEEQANASSRKLRMKEEGDEADEHSEEDIAMDQTLNEEDIFASCQEFMTKGMIPQVPCSREFIVELEKTESNAKLGLAVDASDGTKLKVDGIGEGMAAAYNASVDVDKQIQVGDCIVEINGCRDDVFGMTEKVKDSDKLTLVVRRTQITDFENERRLWIGGLPESLTTEHLEQHFAGIASKPTIVAMMANCTASCGFASKEEAAKAIDLVNGTEINGHPITVDVWGKKRASASIISGVWQVQEQSIPAEFFYELDLMSGGRVRGMGRKKDSTKWESTVDGKLEEDRVEWVEYMQGEKVGSFECSIIDGRLYAGFGELTDGTALYFEGTKVSDLMNDAGFPVHLGKEKIGEAGSEDCKYYCGRSLGRAALLYGGQVTANRCGPDNGLQCASCWRFQHHDSVTVMFEPGPLGFKHLDGCTISEIINGSQAQRAGVEIGWKLAAVGRYVVTNFNDKLFQDAKTGGVPYEVSFKKAAQAVPSTTTEGESEPKVETQATDAEVDGKSKIKEEPAVEKEVEIEKKADDAATATDGAESTLIRLEGDVIVTLKPGPVGFKHTDGYVISSVLDGGQAQKAGLKPGWRIVGVGDQACGFNDAPFQDAKKGDAPYQVTFAKAKDEMTAGVTAEVESGLEGDVTVTFKPGPVGFKHTDGFVISTVLDGGQAHKAGLKPGWRIVRVGDEACGFNDAPFQNAKAGDAPYQVTFAKTDNAMTAKESGSEENVKPGVSESIKAINHVDLKATGLNGFWKVHEHTVPAEFCYTLEEVDGNVSGKGRSSDSPTWQSTMKGTLQGDKLEWTEYMDGEMVGIFTADFSASECRLSHGIGTLTNGTPLEFDGTKVSSLPVASSSQEESEAVEKLAVQPEAVNEEKPTFDTQERVEQPPEPDELFVEPESDNEADHEPDMEEGVIEIEQEECELPLCPSTAKRLDQLAKLDHIRLLLIRNKTSKLEDYEKAMNDIQQSKEWFECVVGWSNDTPILCFLKDKSCQSRFLDRVTKLCEGHVRLFSPLNVKFQKDHCDDLRFLIAEAGNVAPVAVGSGAPFKVKTFNDGGDNWSLEVAAKRAVCITMTYDHDKREQVVRVREDLLQEWNVTISQLKECLTKLQSLYRIRILSTKRTLRFIGRYPKQHPVTIARKAKQPPESASIQTP